MTKAIKFIATFSAGVLLLLTLIFPGLKAQDKENASSYDSLVGVARKLVKDQKFADADQLCQTAIRLDANRWEAYALEGSVLSLQQHYSDAIPLFEKAIAKAPPDRTAALAQALNQAKAAIGGKTSVAETSASPAPTQAEVVLWKTIENSNNTEDFTAYLSQYPTGTFAVLARSRLGKFALVQARAAYAAKDFALAVKLYLQAANGGSIDADGMLNTGFPYYSGQGVPLDHAEAMKWFRKAVDAGNNQAMINIGVQYENGQGVPQDYNEAMKWYRRAADAGNNIAMSAIGGMYHGGSGVPQDYVEAMKWYRKAADAGNNIGMYGIGVLYENGRGLSPDRNEAISWYRKAAAAGNRDALEDLKRLGAK